VPGKACPVETCQQSGELLDCDLHAGDPPFSGLYLSDRWALSVEAANSVTLGADTVDLETAADLCLRVVCDGNEIARADDETPCSFPPPAKACPLLTLTPPPTGSCEVEVTECSGACATPGRARYRVFAVGGALSLASDAGIPAPGFTSQLSCTQETADRYSFEVSKGQEVTVSADTVDAATAADLSFVGSCQGGEVFSGDNDDVACTFPPPANQCPQASFVAASDETCTVEVRRGSSICASSVAQYRLRVTGGTDLAMTASGITNLASCGNGIVEPGETCDGSGPGVCPAGATCLACQCQVPVPDVQRNRVDMARSTIAGAGLVGEVTTPFVQVVKQPPSQVTSQNPDGGKTAGLGTSVDLMVSVPPDQGDFLRYFDGARETAQSAQAYYNAIDPCGQRATLESWLAANQFGSPGADHAAAVYENHNDLGFGRRMHVRQNAPDWVAYYVQNFPTVDDAWKRPENIRATVAMEFSPPVSPSSCQPGTGSPFIKFYTFGPDGQRILAVDLDGRGEKYQPEMCTVCHGGGIPANLDYASIQGDIGAHFIPFDLDSFRYSQQNPLLARAAQEDAFKVLNIQVLNGAAGSKDAQNLVCQWYGGSGGCTTLPTNFDGTQVPMLWTPAGGATSQEEELYQRVVRTSCRACHLQRSPSFASATEFESYTSLGRSATSLGRIGDYVCGMGLMPRALKTFDNFWLGDDPNGRYPPEVLNDFLKQFLHDTSITACAKDGPQPVACSPVTAWGSMGSGEGQFEGPRDVALDGTGNVYVSDRDNNRIEKFDNNGTFLLTFGWGVKDGMATFETCKSSCLAAIKGSGNGQFNFPNGVGVDAEGNVYVADSGNNRIQKFMSDGTFVTMLSGTGTQNELFSPNDVAVDMSGNVYVADSLNNRIQKFQSDGTIVKMWGSMGTGNGQFNFPSSIAVDQSGNVSAGTSCDPQDPCIYVTDQNNNRIVKFRSDGTFIATWGWGVTDGSAMSEVCTSSCQAGISGSGAGQFSGPAGIAVDGAGNVYVADAGNSRIQKFLSDGTVPTLWGTSGTDGGVAVDGNGDVFVADGSNDSIQKFVCP
jgi:sugar lactone lactonase YvrE